MILIIQKELGMLRELFSSVPITATTATATREQIQSVCSVLKMSNPVFIEYVPRRTELRYNS